MFKRFLHGFVLLAFVAGLLAVTPVTPAYAATLTVNTLVDENDLSCVDGDCSLRDALILAASGDTINFSVSGTITLGSNLDIQTDVDIVGPGSASLILSQGNPSSYVFYTNSGLVISMSGMTIQDGKNSGIYLNGSDLTLDDMLIKNNTATAAGGGIYLNNAASLTVTNSTFSNNTATNLSSLGGAIFASNSRPVSLTNVKFNNNSAAFGGAVGILATGAPATLVWDQIAMSQNTATSEGGGIYADQVNLTIKNSTFDGNSASNYGGGIEFAGATTYNLSNVTISGNNAVGVNSYGGGIAMFNNAIVNINNTTIAGNSALIQGGGMYGYNSPIINLTNNIVGDNSAPNTPDCEAFIDSGDYNLIEDTSGCTLPVSIPNTITGQDPKLNALGLVDNVLLHSLQSDSPAIDAGDNSTCEGKDQRGVIRPEDGENNGTATCDMGAYEHMLLPEVLAITRVNLDPTGLAFVDFTVTFSEDVNDVDVADFILVQSGVSGASITNVSGANNTYTVTVDTGIGNGTLRVDVPVSATVTDLSGNPLAGSPFTSGETYTVTKTAPAQIVPSNGAVLQTLRPLFDWTDYATAKGYQIQVSKSAGFGTTLVNVTLSGANNSRYTPTKDLPANSLLNWRVRAKLSATKYSAWSSTFTFTTGNPPSVPSLLSPANNGLLTNLTPTLDWSDSTIPAGTTFAHYQVQMDDNADFSSPMLDEITAVSTYTTAILDQNTKYYWRVRALNMAGDSSSWSLVRTFREAMPAPTLISPVLGVTVGNLKPLFDWSDVSGATGYSIQVSLSSNFGSLAINATINTPTSQYTHSINLAAGKLYYWRVRANGPNGPSPWSAVETFHTP